MLSPQSNFNFSQYYFLLLAHHRGMCQTQEGSYQFPAEGSEREAGRMRSVWIGWSEALSYSYRSSVRAAGIVSTAARASEDSGWNTFFFWQIINYCTATRFSPEITHCREERVMLAAGRQ